MFAQQITSTLEQMIMIEKLLAKGKKIIKISLL